MPAVEFPFPTSMDAYPCPLMGTLWPLARVTLAPLLVVLTVKPASWAAIWLVAPESNSQVEEPLVLPEELRFPAWPADAA